MVLITSALNAVLIIFKELKITSIRGNITFYPIFNNFLQKIPDADEDGEEEEDNVKEEIKPKKHKQEVCQF